MEKCELMIAENSLWMTATPTSLAKTLPFYITEAGRFIAGSSYSTQRDTHDSFLLLYTISGQGLVRTGDTALQLTQGNTVIIDCHRTHEYRSVSDTWDFLWIHFCGNSVIPLLNIIYPDNNIRAVNMQNSKGFENKIAALIDLTNKNDVSSYITASSQMHSLLNSVYLSDLENDKIRTEKINADDMKSAIDFIEKNYSSPITIDDIVANVHISKYYFIRRFHRAMGITPYSYLTNYRINMSKTLLRTTDKSVAEIAELCGFADTSNFISHFKKHTGQKPLGYRRDFS